MAWTSGPQVSHLSRLQGSLPPLEDWDAQNLARLASAVGELDEQTGSLGRCEYARVCVRLDLSKRLPKGVWAIGFNGRFFQLHCGIVGHRADACQLRQEAGQDLENRPILLKVIIREARMEKSKLISIEVWRIPPEGHVEARTSTTSQR